VCGDTVPEYIKGAVKRGVVKRRSVSELTNLVFLASLAFTCYCYFVAHNLSLPVTVLICATLLLLRIFAQWMVNKSSN
jgi:hypothetical protein